VWDRRGKVEIRRPDVVRMLEFREVFGEEEKIS
jgi:hypothetical protein